MKLDLLISSLVVATLATLASAGGHHGKKKRGKHGKSGKSSKHEMEFDECAFANPTLDQATTALELSDRLDCQCLATEIGPHIEHATASNAIFAAEVKKWSDGVVEYEDIYERGVEIGESHVWFTDQLPEDVLTMLFCTTATTLVSQMNTTCDYDTFKPAYETVALALMDGFGLGINSTLTVDECE